MHTFLVILFHTYGPRLTGTRRFGTRLDTVLVYTESMDSFVYLDNLFHDLQCPNRFSRLGEYPLTIS